MPFTTIRACFIVDTEHASQAREILETVLDQLAIQDVPVEDLTVTEECAEAPSGT